MKVCDLVPGDRFQDAAGTAAIFVARTRHPLYSSLQLVIWWMEADRRYMLDALDLRQHLGMSLVSSIHDRHANLRKAILEAQQE